MGLKISNQAFGILASGITAVATSIPLSTGHGARFGTFAAGDFMYATLITNANQLELVKIVGRAGDTLDVTGGRGQDGTTPLAFSAGERIECRPCNAAMAEFALKSELAAFLAAAGIGPSTGDVKPTFKAVADTGWVMMNDGTIGNAASGGTTRANADTLDLFTLLWTNVINQWAPVSGGRGGSAAADFAANKTIRLPRQLGRALVAGGLGTFTSLFTADAGTDVLTIDSNSSVYTGATVRVSNSGGGLPAPLLAATDYFAIRTAATTMKLATTLANAHAGTAIDLTTAGSGTHTLTMTFTNRALGEHAGEEAHSITQTETGPHQHPATDTTSTGAHAHSVQGGAGSGAVNGVSIAVDNATALGGNTVAGAALSAGAHIHSVTVLSQGDGTPHPNLPPSSFMNVMIKL